MAFHVWTFVYLSNTARPARIYRRYLLNPPLVDLGPPGGRWRKILLRAVLVCQGWKQALRGGGWMCLSETRVLVSLSEVLVSLSEVK